MRTFSCDIETDGLSPKIVWCIVVQNVDTNEVTAFHGNTLGLFKTWLSMEVDCLVFHGGIHYDVPVLERLMSVDFTGTKVEDTLILSQLDEPRREGGHSLESWGDRLQYDKGDYSDWSKFTPEMLEYCQRDVEITTKLYNILQRKNLNEDAKDLEYKIRGYCSEQERTGWYFDERGAIQLLRKVTEDLGLAENMVHPAFPPLPVWTSKKPCVQKFKKDYTRTKAYIGEVALQCHTNDAGDYGYWAYPELNLGSRQQVARHLQHYGWKPTVFTETGRPKVDETTLEDVEIPEAKLISRYLMLQKRQGQLNSWLKEYNPKTKRIHARVHTMGTVTHRMSSSNPNLQQVTANGKEYGTEMRSLFTVPEGKVLVGADLSGLELRCLAHYMKDDKYTSEILSGDIHTANQQAAGLSTRDEAKTFIYAFIYGGGDELVGKIVGGGKTEGKDIKSKFLEAIPALGELLKKVQYKSKQGYINALDGRKVYVRSSHSALNFLLQSAGAIIAKRAWVIFHSLAGHLDYKQLGLIHDEAQIECNPEDAEEIGRLLVRGMEETTDYYKLNCPITGEYKIARSWDGTH